MLHCKRPWHLARVRFRCSLIEITRHRSRKDGLQREREMKEEKGKRGKKEGRGESKMDRQKMVEEDPASADHQGCPTSTFDGHTVHAKYKLRTETD